MHMKRERLIVALVLGLGVSSLAAKELAFEERVEAQRTIDRIYYSHQLGAPRPFDGAVPQEVTERKVATYLKESVALDTLWHTPVTQAMLQRELERIAAGTRMPERLRELYAALGDDPFVVAECVARPVLVDRLSRSFFAWDERIHGEARRHAEMLRAELSSFDPEALAADSRGRVFEIVASSEMVLAPGMPGDSDALRLSPEEFRRRRMQAPVAVGELGPIRENSDAFEMEAVLSETAEQLRMVRFAIPKVPWEDWWETVSETLEANSVRAVGIDGEVPYPSAGAPSDVWDNGSLDDLPDPRGHHTAVWTGTYMIVWGGGDAFHDDGALYDPATDTWRPMTRVSAPEGRRDHAAVWTGREMVVWGGLGVNGVLSTGGRYDPIVDRWSATSLVGAPSARTWHTAVWTGSRMVVWGGNGGTDLDTGGIYDPRRDRWIATSLVRSPSPRSLHTAVWTGKWMIVWGGQGPLNTGGRYDPARDKWASVSSAGPGGRYLHTAVWTGTEMIVFGGFSHKSLGDGGRYDPAADRWTPISRADGPGRRNQHVAVWTGSRMLVWAGDGPPDGYPMNTGGQYDPATNTWRFDSLFPFARCR
jgi:hypothetical protein